MKNSNNSEDIKKLLQPIKMMPSIPVELLCQYYIRAYTAESDFYRDINENLRKSKKENYLIFIKVLYEGIRLKALPLASENELYRGTCISNDEIKIIRNYLDKKLDNLPAAIVFSRAFLSFSKGKSIEENFLDNIVNDKFLKELFILKKDDNIDYS